MRLRCVRCFVQGYRVKLGPDCPDIQAGFFFFFLREVMPHKPLKTQTNKNPKFMKQLISELLAKTDLKMVRLGMEVLGQKYAGTAGLTTESLVGV